MGKEDNQQISALRKCTRWNYLTRIIKMLHKVRAKTLATNGKTVSTINRKYKKEPNENFRTEKYYNQNKKLTN